MPHYSCYTVPTSSFISGDSGFEQSHLHNHPGGVGRRSPPIVLRQQTAAQKQRARHAKIDRFFLVFFPVLFLIFNIVYWAAFHLWGQKFTKTAIVEGCGVPTSLSHTLCYAACCWAAFSSYSHNGLVFCIGKHQGWSNNIIFLLFLLNPNYFFPIWFWIVLMYQIWESFRNKFINHSVTKIVLTFCCSNKLF